MQYIPFPLRKCELQCEMGEIFRFPVFQDIFQYFKIFSDISKHFPICISKYCQKINDNFPEIMLSMAAEGYLSIIEKNIFLFEIEKKIHLK